MNSKKIESEILDLLVKDWSSKLGRKIEVLKPGVAHGVEMYHYPYCLQLARKKERYREEYDV